LDFPNLLMASPLFDRLQGLRLERVSWNGPVLVLGFSAHHDTESLLVYLHQDMQGFHLETRSQEEFEQIQFQDGRHDFSFLPPHLEGSTFLAGAPCKGQSLLRLDFASSGNFKEDIPLFVYLEFFGGGRLVLTDRDNRVIRASRKGGPQHRPGAHYWPGEADLAEFGQDLPLSPAAFAAWPASLLERVRAGGEAPIDEDALRSLRGFSPDSARFLIDRARPKPRQAPEEVLARRLARWVRRVQQGRTSIHVVSLPAEMPRSCQIHPYSLDYPAWHALRELALDIAPFNDYVEALNHLGRRCLARLQVMELLGGVRKTLLQRLARERRLLGRLERDWDASFASRWSRRSRRRRTWAGSTSGLPRASGA
jgi:hypothetical protein